MHVFDVLLGRLPKKAWKSPILRTKIQNAEISGKIRQYENSFNAFIQANFGFYSSMKKEKNVYLQDTYQLYDRIRSHKRIIRESIDQNLNAAILDESTRPNQRIGNLTTSMVVSNGTINITGNTQAVPFFGRITN
jgi:hypothetical protein